MRWALPIAIGLLMTSAAQGAESPAEATYLRCEYRVDPLGIDVLQPRLSWEMHDARRGAAQTAYQVLVATTPEKLAADQGDLWDSGRVASDAVGADRLCRQSRWRRGRDATGRSASGTPTAKPTAFSKPAFWSMGLLQVPADVEAKWIGVDGPMIYPGKGTGAHAWTGCSWVWFPEAGESAQKTAPKATRFFRGSR